MSLFAYIATSSVVEEAESILNMLSTCAPIYTSRFYGDWWHGCSKHTDHKETNVKLQLTFGDLHHATVRREAALKAAGYQVVDRFYLFTKRRPRCTLVICRLSTFGNVILLTYNTMTKQWHVFVVILTFLYQLFALKTPWLEGGLRP